MLKRKITQKLLEWKNTPQHKPLIIKGCRQCGKTYSTLDFAKKNYQSVVYINFFEDSAYKDIFAGSLNVDNLIMLMSALLPEPVEFIPGQTIIILDEIQECPDARTALKFFHLDGRFDVICTGSLLGVKGYRDDVRSIPVGYETFLKMFPLDFEEFLWAMGIDEKIIALLADCLAREQMVPKAIHQKMRELLLQYIIVGGMPDVVSTFKNSNNIGLVQELQRNIVDSYTDDMIKYADSKIKAAIRKCFLSIPMQLGKENKKFQYSLVQKGGTASKFQGCLEWIEDAGIISRCYNISNFELPLNGVILRDKFKVYMQDIGLLVSMLDPGTASNILRGDLAVYKGAVYENLVADFFIKMERSLYYFRRDSGLEIDFVLRYHDKCTPLEVKAMSGNAKSLRTVLNSFERYHVESAIKLGDYNVGRQDKVLTLPLYMGFLLKGY